LDELIGLTPDEQARALKRPRDVWEKLDPATRGDCPDTPSGLQIREARPHNRGLLLVYPIQLYREDVPLETRCEQPIVGLALSFPAAKLGTDEGVEYRVNNIYWDQEFELK
jgi:hypothetical protein